MSRHGNCILRCLMESVGSIKEETSLTSNEKFSLRRFQANEQTINQLTPLQKVFLIFSLPYSTLDSLSHHHHYQYEKNAVFSAQTVCLSSTNKDKLFVTYASLLCNIINA